MSNNPMPNEQGTKILRTNTARMLRRWGLWCLLIGAIVGLCIMLVINLGIVDGVVNLFTKETAEVVAHVASNEMKEAGLGTVTGEKIDLKKYGVKFEFTPVTYDGKPHEVTAKNVDNLPAGITVTYRNNVHTNAGTYVAEAIFSGEGYVPEVLTATMVINKAKITGVSIKSEVVQYVEGKTYSIELLGEENIPEGATVVYQPPKGEEVSEPGIYKSTVIITVEDGNYETLVLSGTLTIVDLKQLVKFDNESYKYTYDGKSQVISLNTKDVSSSIKNAIGFKVTYTYTDAEGKEHSGNTFTNAGTYTLTAHVSAKGFDSFDVGTVTVTIEQGDLVELYGTAVAGKTGEYNGEKYTVDITGEHPKSIEVTTEYYLNDEKVDNAIVPGTYKVKVTFTDKNGNIKTTTLECEIVITKIDISDCITFEGVEREYGENEEGNEIVSSIEVKIDEAALAAKGLSLSNLKITYYDGTTESSEPFTFTQAGEHVVKAVVEISENIEYFDDVELEAIVKITPAYTDTIDKCEVNSFKLAMYNGNYIKPTTRSLKGTVVEHRITGMLFGWLNGTKKDVVVPGVKYADYYTVETTFINGNYYTTRDTNILVLPNPEIVFVFAAIGILAGLGIAAVIIVKNKDKEEDSDIKFQRPSAAIAKARGKIVCESRAISKSSGVEGRLYLTEKTVEFYSSTLSKSDDNILIPLRNVRNIDVVAHNVIDVRANNENYIFEVPGCVAKDWKYEMVNVEEAKRAIAAKSSPEAQVAQPQTTAPAEEVRAEEVKTEENTEN